jgi:hypothetical protein
MNSFYQIPKLLQWIFTLIFAGVGVFVCTLWFQTADNLFLMILSVFLVVPIIQFLFTPFFTLIKVYQYLSPMLLVFGATPERYDLHNGTSFDYLFVYRNTKAGMNWQNKLLACFMEGLLVIIDRIESGELPETIEVRGSSYFLSDATIKRLGFESKATGWGEKLNLLVNYLDLMWMYSLSKGRLAYPNLKNIKTITTTGGELVRQKEQFQRMKNFLENR